MDVQPKKSLGQHWLHDDFSLNSMCESAQIKSGDFVIEIGPGLGTLTQKLLDNGANVLAVEFDDNLANKLAKKFGEKIKVVNQDILKFNFEEQPSGYKICANIPYYLTSNLIRILTELNNKPEIVTLLVQKEVAERICANPGQMSLLSVWAQSVFECSLGEVVPASLFTPPPKVDSQIVVLKKRPRSTFEGDAKNINRVIKAGFSSKRKTLLNNLSSGLNIDKTQVQNILNMLSIDTNIRAQQFSTEDWVTISKAFSKYLAS